MYSNYLGFHMAKKYIKINSLKRERGKKSAFSLSTLSRTKTKEKDSRVMRFDSLLSSWLLAI